LISASVESGNCAHTREQEINTRKTIRTTAFIWADRVHYFPVSKKVVEQPF
jgi:hypothetical protein